MRQAIILGVIVLLGGCGTAPPRQPVAFDQYRFDQGFSRIHVMPVVDERVDRSTKLELDDLTRLRESTTAILTNAKGYEIILVDLWQNNSSVAGQEISDLAVAELAQVVPEDAQIFMVISVNDVIDKYRVLTASYSMTATFRLIDRNSKAEIWKDVATGETSGAGMMDAAMSLVGKRKAAQNALVRTALSSLPASRSKSGSVGGR